MIYSENIESKVMDKVFKSGESKICGRQVFKKFEGIWSAYKGYGLLRQTISLQIF